MIFDNIVYAAQALYKAETNQDTISFKTPHVALKSGPLLKKCCVVLTGIALRNGNEQEWKTKVTSIALRSQKHQKRNKQVLFPTADDLLKLKRHIEAALQQECRKLKDTPGVIAGSGKVGPVNQVYHTSLMAVVLLQLTVLSRSATAV